MRLAYPPKPLFMGYGEKCSHFSESSHNKDGAYHEVCDEKTPVLGSPSDRAVPELITSPVPVAQAINREH